MRRSLPFLILLLATTSCGQGGGSRSEPRPSAQMSNAASASYEAPAAAEGQASRDGGPNVAPTAAPGVAFTYRYAFRLAAPRIAEVQERHAQMCEQLTVARCRITGMLYRVVNDTDIEAMLAFKLDPAAARHFGREAVGVVVQSEGMLTESEITGTDVGTDIRAAGRSLAQLEADLARIEARLRQGVSADERARLDYDAQQLRAQIRDLRAHQQTQEESLATTPMVFRYGSGDLVPGFAPRPTLGQALKDAGEVFVDSAYILLRILIALLPWAVALGLIAGIALLIRRRFGKPAAPAG